MNNQQVFDLVISQRGLAKALGAAKPGSMTRRGAGKLPAFLTAKNLNPFIGNDLIKAATPIEYTPISGGRNGLDRSPDLIGVTVVI